MTKTSIKYNNTVIYKIVCKNLNIKNVYVGHTTDLTKRKHAHKSTCNDANKKGHNFKVYKFIRENGGFNNWCIIEIEKFNCCDGHEARARERYWFEQLNADLNDEVPNQTVQEYRIANKEKLNKRDKIYRDNNIDKMQEKHKRYYDRNKEKLLEKYECICGSCICSITKTRHEKSKKHLTFINII
jgi:hypothetical protein